MNMSFIKVSFTAVLILISNAMAAEQQPVEVKMLSISYEPKQVELHVGQSVVWKNVSLTDHSATSNDGKTFDTDAVDPGKSSKPVHFTKAGTYPYHCMVHGLSMSGVVDVK